MNDKEWRVKVDLKLAELEAKTATVQQLEQAFQLVWKWMIVNKQFADLLPFTTVKPTDEKSEKPISPESNS